MSQGLSNSDRLRLRTSRPDNEVPIVLAAAAVLGRTDDAVVALVGVSAYTTGLHLDVVVRLRVRPQDMQHGSLHDLVTGWGSGGQGAAGLLLGLEYADGRTASSLGGPRGLPFGAEDDDESVLVAQGSGGSDLSVDQGWWLSPLPPDGPLVVVCAFQTVGIGETRTELSQEWTTAGNRAQVLWPWQPEDASPPPEPELPTSGWFASRPQQHDA